MAVGTSQWMDALDYDHWVLKNPLEVMLGTATVAHVEKAAEPLVFVGLRPTCFLKSPEIMRTNGQVARAGRELLRYMLCHYTTDLHDVVEKWATPGEAGADKDGPPPEWTWSKIPGVVSQQGAAFGGATLDDVKSLAPWCKSTDEMCGVFPFEDSQPEFTVPIAWRGNDVGDDMKKIPSPLTVHETVLTPPVPNYYPEYNPPPAAGLCREAYRMLMLDWIFISVNQSESEQCDGYPVQD